MLAPLAGRARPGNASGMNVLTHLAVYRRLGFLCLGWLLFFSAARLLLLFLYQERVAVTGGSGFILLQGLRFDALLLGALLGPALLLWPWLHSTRWLSRPGAWLIGSYLGLVSAFAFFVEASSAPFIGQFDTRPNYLFVEYLRYPREVLATLAGTHLVQLLLFSAIAIALALLVARWFITDPRRQQRVPLRFCLLVTPLALALVTALVRGTLDHRPLNPSNAAFSRDAMVNQLALNSPYTVLYAIYERGRDAALERIEYGWYDGLDVLRVIRREAGIATEAVLDPDIPTLHLQTATRPRARPYNLVIVLEESLGADYVGSLGGKDLTPRLDALADQGIWFERLYATGLRSANGVEAVISGFTPTPLQPVLKHPQTQSGFFTLAGLLARHGYHTSFLYGGESHFDNMRRFMLNNGFAEIVDENDFADPVFHGSWGVSDEDVLQRAHAQFSAAGEQPFFALVFTTSHHEPFDIPPGRVEPSADGPRETTVRYADWALGQFIDSARASAYWDDTVILVIADHNARVFGGYLVPVERYRIPGVILGAGIEPRRVPGITSQIDMLPTLLSLIGLSAAHPGIGRDLTLPQYRDGAGRALMQFHANQAYMEDEWIIVLRPDEEPMSFQLDAAGEWVWDNTSPWQLKHKALAYAYFGPLMIRTGAYRLGEQ